MPFNLADLTKKVGELRQERGAPPPTMTYEERKEIAELERATQMPEGIDFSALWTDEPKSQLLTLIIPAVSGLISVITLLVVIFK